MRHYTLEEWENYINENVSNIERSLMEEHMAGCDHCTNLYLQALESSDLLMEAPDSLTDKIMSSINAPVYKLPVSKKNTPFRMFMRYAVAATFSLLLWQLGIFPEFGQKISYVENMTYQNTFFDSVLNNDLKGRFIENLNNTINKIDLKGDH